MKDESRILRYVPPISCTYGGRKREVGRPSEHGEGAEGHRFTLSLKQDWRQQTEYLSGVSFSV